MRMYPNKLLKLLAALDFGILGSVAIIETLDIWVRVVGGIVGIIVACFLIWQIFFQKRLTDIQIQTKLIEKQIKEQELYECMERSKRIPVRKRKRKVK